MSKTPEPKWQSLYKDGSIEIRHYNSMIVAETTVKGERYTAINNGFRILANYIFGGNAEQQKIEMTAPVVQEANRGQKIAMTAPVIQEATNQTNEWNVRFVMPAEYTTIASLPKTNDTRIKFIEIPAYHVAVVKFSGFNTDANLKQHKKMLVDWLVSQKIKPISEPIFAFYNPPWTLPFMRRNEVMIKIEKWKL
jgi:hypothetical protein